MKIRTLNATITGFDAKGGKLTVFFIPTGNETKFRISAHPALQVKPYIGNAIDIQIAKADDGWKLVSPAPTAEEIAQWEARKASNIEVDATPEQLAFLASF